MLTKKWKSFVKGTAKKVPYIFTGCQAIYPNIQWTFPARCLLEDDQMTLPRIGYTPTKIRQLKTHYLNQPTIDRAKKDLHERIASKKYGSGVWDFRGETKKTTKQDYCLTSGIISYYPQHKSTRIFIQYRTVELIFRFRADLIFLRDIILPQFDLKKMPADLITFQFVNCTIHPMFYIMMLVECKNIFEYGNHMEELKIKNPKLFKEIIRWTDIHLSGRYKSYATAARVQKFVERFNSPILPDLKEFIKENRK